ncbi:DNA-directed RNA polymerase subunit beta [Candidatus Saccharibacteria bacterium]|jgi:DNA-directed RNA polymerase subunit beta|nr:DNA-directed RNA polymerase subunit beta [Candidatus Saccharibacteria bacterium]
MAQTELAKRSKRVSFTKSDDALEIPNLVEHQTKSFHQFVQEGLGEIFAEINPIEDYTGTKIELRFKEYHFDDPKISEVEARDNNVSFEAPLYANLELTNKVTGEVKEHEIYLGDYPWMTSRGTFIINGAERVVVSQLIRSPGIFFTGDNVGDKRHYGAKLIPGRGAWMEFETAANGAIYVKIDRRRKLPITTLLRALGYSQDTQLKELFKDVDNGDESYIDNTIAKDTSKGNSDALIEVYRRIRPGDLATVDNARSLIENIFFNFKRFDLSRVGRYKMNKRLDIDVANVAENRVMRLEDLVAIIKEIIRLNNTQEAPDDIDSLANRRVKLVGELVQRQFRIGLLRMERNAKDRMSMSEIETVTPAQLINARPIVAAVREFFASSQLSQFMDQTNPLSELAHKRRLSSMGPGGLSRERAGFEVRDAHATHYGRLCVVETPEGANIGLVLSLGSHARINEYGFIESPYRVVKDGKVTKEVVYLDADEEKRAVIASAGIELNKDGSFVPERVSARVKLQAEEVDAELATHMDAARNQLLGSTASLIPFVEKDNVGRSLIASSQQKQAVPLIKTKAPIIGTGMEEIVARNSGQVIYAEADGTVTKADANEVVVKYEKTKKTYKLHHFIRTNDSSSMNQKVVVHTGDSVKVGDALIEGMSIEDGELALGKDLTVAYMPWGGYNFEDSIVISRRIVEDDELTSVHISDYMVEVRETKLGPEIVTRDIPNVSEESLRHLDESGIVRVGAEVKTGDILVGKITPKGEQELSSEERLLRAIFGEKAKDVRDTSQRMNNGKHGKVVGVKIFSRDNGHDLKAGVLMQVQVFVAQMRKIAVGDKLAGRHGNKGVIAKIVPAEDMPFLEDGTPVDMVLNPLGIPSRLNIGQLFEVHLGMAAKALGYKVATPAFNGVDIADVKAQLKKAGLPEDGKQMLIDGRTGEYFKERVTVGIMHIIKLHHMIADKIHARSIGPYTMVTQQPLGGKAQNGGQRFGEMEVWALEAYGAANTLQEMLTLKSDDVFGRSKAYESIIKQEPIVGPKIPESFNVLVKELQGLSLRVDLMNSEVGEIDAEDMLEASTAEDALNAPEGIALDMDPIDVTEEMVASEFEIVDEPVAAVADDDDDDSTDDADDNQQDSKQEEA